ncbi:hypothetical protein R84B8_02229 [Treponema sp. R8-4-B8]
MKIFFNKPPCFLRRLFSACFVIVLSACVTTGKQITDDSSAAKTGIIVFTNKTNFTVHLVRGTGRIDVGSIKPGSSLNVPNTFESAEDYYPLFDVPLTGSYSLSRLKPKDADFYYRIDNKIARQEIEILAPPLIDNSLSYAPVYIIFTHHNNKTGGVSLSRNVSRNQMTGINFSESKSNININETMIFRENPRDLQNLRLNPVNISFGEMAYQAGFIYSFVFEESGVTLTDARPLHRAGENAWAKIIPNAAGPMRLVTSDNEICLFASTDKEIIRNIYDSSGNAKGSVSARDSFDIRFTSSAGDGFFTAGFEELANGDHKPIARIYDKNGAIKSILEPSVKRDCRSAYYTTAAQKDNVNWLLAGGGAENSTQGYKAYARQVRDEGSRLTVLWELTGSDFDGKASGVKCGNITAAVYAKNSWIVSGEILSFDLLGNPVKASYIAEISNDGKIQKIDASFKNMTFNKIVTDSNGSCYLAGDEQIGNESYAILVKYGPNVKLVVSQPASHSYYQDALFDASYNRIILTGTLRAKNEAGNGGVPFIDAVDVEKGSLLWREELSDALLDKTALVTAIKPAPDYGFVITLSGVNDYYDKPYMIARINSYGKLIKELQK